MVSPPSTTRRNMLLGTFLLPATVVGYEDNLQRTTYLPGKFERVYDTAQASWLAPNPAMTLATKLADAPVVVLGETHPARSHHHVQLDILRALHEKQRARQGGEEAPATLAIGLEQFYRQQQPLLDRYIFDPGMGIGELERLTDWKTTWGWDANSGYSKIFAYAKAHGIRLIGLNCPKPLVDFVAESGLAGLPSELQPFLPARMELTNKAHRKRFDAAMDSIPGGSHVTNQGPGSTDGGTSSIASLELRERYYQCTVLWEEYMAETAVQFLRGDIPVATSVLPKERQPQPHQLVALAGSQHVLGRHGLPNRIARRLQEAAASTDHAGATSAPPAPVLTVVPRSVRWLAQGIPLLGEGGLPMPEDADWVWYTQEDFAQTAKS